jgi:hypothetical protein
LTIGPWVCNRDIFDLDARIFIQLPKLVAMKFEPRSVMMVFGKPKRSKISEMKSTIRSGMSLAIGLYSIHVVNLSIVTNTWVKPPGAFVKGPIISRLQQANGQV